MQQFIKCFLTLPLLLSAACVFCQDVPPKYKSKFIKFADNRDVFEKSLNAVGLTKNEVGKSFALIAGVSKYPNMSLDPDLKPADEDIRKLVYYLKYYEFFDEIVVLQNADVTVENLEFFLQNYFPDRLKSFPKSRFLFAYSGHGMSEQGKGYLLKTTARSLADKSNAINASILRTYLDEVVASAHHTLVLLNACYSGAFLKRPFGGSDPLMTNPALYTPKYEGAHVITAGGTSELTFHDATVGTGSVFFEKLFAGLGGRADVDKNGLVTTGELSLYLRREVQISTDQTQNPLSGDLSKDGSQGEFFFLNRNVQVEKQLVPKWDARMAQGFGDMANVQPVGDEKTESISKRASAFKMIAGRVTNHFRGPLEDARVGIAGTPFSALTDEEGDFRIYYNPVVVNDSVLRLEFSHKKYANEYDTLPPSEKVSMIMSKLAKPGSYNEKLLFETIIKGVVRNDFGGNPISSVEVRLDGTDIRTFTDYDGEFTLLCPLVKDSRGLYLPDKNVTKLIFSRHGFYSQTITFDRKQPSKSIPKVKVKMKMNSKEILEGIK